MHKYHITTLPHFPYQKLILGGTGVQYNIHSLASVTDKCLSHRPQAQLPFMVHSSAWSNQP